MKIRRILFVIGVFSLSLACVVNGQVNNKATFDGEQTLEFGGLKRSFLIHTPPGFSKKNSLPLVIALHGGGANGKSMDKLTGLNALADEKGFIVVYPDGFYKNWNDGRKNVRHSEVDDVGFISALIDELVKKYKANQKRVYVTGISNGGMMSARLACDLSDKIAAVATVEGNLTVDFAPVCKPKNPIPMLIIHGTTDPIVPFAGGAIYTFGGQGQGRDILSVEAQSQFWAKNNACASKPEAAQLPDADPKDGTKIRRDTFNGCRQNTEVIVYSIVNGGHTWAGGWQYLAERFIGKTTRDINGSQTIWDFFSSKNLK